jgi:hypothetical protein
MIRNEVNSTGQFLKYKIWRKLRKGLQAPAQVAQKPMENTRILIDANRRWLSKERTVHDDVTLCFNALFGSGTIIIAWFIDIQCLGTPTGICTNLSCNATIAEQSPAIECCDRLMYQSV